MIDVETQRKAMAAYTAAMQNNYNWLEELDRRGLLATKETRKKIEREVLDQLINQLEGYPAALIAGSDQTVQGAVDGAIRIVHIFRDLVAS